MLFTRQGFNMPAAARPKRKCPAASTKETGTRWPTRRRSTAASTAPSSAARTAAGRRKALPSEVLHILAAAIEQAFAPATQ